MNMSRRMLLCSLFYVVLMSNEMMAIFFSDLSFSFNLNEKDLYQNSSGQSIVEDVRSKKVFVTKEDGPHYLLNVSIDGKENCYKELRVQYEAIIEWKKRLGEDLFEGSRNFHYFSDRKICQVEITALMPKAITHFDLCERFCQQDGPNCWGSCMEAASLFDDVLYSSDTLFSQVLSSSLCREREGNEELRAGDIVAIRSRTRKDFLSRESIEEIHGAIYLTDKLLWSKNGASKLTPFSFQSSSFIFESYHVSSSLDKEGKKLCYHQNSQYVDPLCDIYVTYYDCLPKNYSITFPYYEAIFKEAEKVAHDYSRHVFLGEKFNAVHGKKKLEELLEQVQREESWTSYLLSILFSTEKERLVSYINSVIESLDFM